MPRYYAAISDAEFRAKVVKLDENDGEAFYKLVEKEAKVKFDWENASDRYYETADNLVGFRDLGDGLRTFGKWAGGDWEHPVFFVIYWDGKKLRVYVPTDGNPWNTDTNWAYGNNEEADWKNAKKRWPDIFRNSKPDHIDAGSFDFDWSLILADIKSRIIAKPDPGKKKSLRERVEALRFYGTGDEAYELFCEATSFLYSLNGLGDSGNAEIVFKMAKEMADHSLAWYIEEGNDPAAKDADVKPGHYGRMR